MSGAAGGSSCLPPHKTTFDSVKCSIVGKHWSVLEHFPGVSVSFNLRNTNKEVKEVQFYFLVKLCFEDHKTMICYYWWITLKCIELSDVTNGIVLH